MANGLPEKVKVGAGLLYINEVGAPEPMDLTTPWGTVDAGWLAIGYTEEGHEASREPSFEPIEVAEELDPIRYEQNANMMMVSFSAAQITVDNLVYAYNGGIVTPISVGSTVKTFEPPDVGDVTRWALGWESDDGEERWVFRQCLQTGSSAIARRKSPQKALIPMEFRVEQPITGVKPFKAILETA